MGWACITDFLMFFLNLNSIGMPSSSGKCPRAMSTSFLMLFGIVVLGSFKIMATKNTAMMVRKSSFSFLFKIYGVSGTESRISEAKTGEI